MRRNTYLFMLAALAATLVPKKRASIEAAAWFWFLAGSASYVGAHLVCWGLG